MEGTFLWTDIYREVCAQDLAVFNADFDRQEREFNEIIGRYWQRRRVKAVRELSGLFWELLAPDLRILSRHTLAHLIDYTIKEYADEGRTRKCCQ